MIPESRLKIAEDFMNSLNQAVYEININNRMATSYFAIACEHHHAIIILIQNRRYSSSLALLRLLFEAYTRGLRILWCDDKSIVDNVINSKENFPYQKELVCAIKKALNLMSISGLNLAMLIAGKS